MEIENRRILVVANPASTNYGLVGETVVEPLVEAWGIDREADVLRTPGPAYADQVEYIGERLMAGVVVVCATGDGGANAVGNAVARSGLEDVHVLFVPGGNACDIACSLNPGEFERPTGVVKLLQDGVPHAIPAIETTPEGMDTRLALGYFGVGATAQISERMGDADWRRRRPSLAWMADMRDAAAILDIVSKSKRLMYRRSGKLESTHEIFAFTINTLAKVMKLDADPLSDDVKVTEFRSRWLLPQFLYRTAIEAMQRGLRGRSLERQDITLSGDAPVRAHYDGEVVQFDPGTKLTLDRRPAALSTVVHPSRLPRLPASH